MSVKKKICIVGLGQFGFELACSLARQCEVLAIDRKKELVEEIQDRVHRALILDVKDFDSLSSVISADFDEAVVSISENLESSILATLHLKHLGVKRIWAKAVNEDHASILQAIGADKIIFPERESARRLASTIENPNFLDFIPITEDYRVLEFRPPEWFSGKDLIQLDLRRLFRISVIAIKQTQPSRFLFMPPPDYVIKPTDTLLIIGREQDITLLRDAKPPED